MNCVQSKSYIRLYLSPLREKKIHWRFGVYNPFASSVGNLKHNPRSGYKLVYLMPWQLVWTPIGDWLLQPQSKEDNVYSLLCAATHRLQRILSIVFIQAHLSHILPDLAPRSSLASSGWSSSVFRPYFNMLLTPEFQLF